MKTLYGLASVILADPSIGQRFSDKVSSFIVEWQVALIAVTALAIIIRVRYPLIWGDEQDVRQVKKRVPWIVLGAAAVGGAIYWANQIVSFVEF